MLFRGADRSTSSARSSTRGAGTARRASRTPRPSRSRRTGSNRSCPCPRPLLRFPLPLTILYCLLSSSPPHTHPLFLLSARARRLTPRRARLPRQTQQDRDRDQEMYDQHMREYLGIDEEVLKEIATKA